MKTITLTDEQELFINTLTEQMETQSNRSTQYPLFYIHEKKEVYNEDGDGRPVYMNEDWQGIDEYETSKGLWKLDSENDIWSLDFSDAEEPPSEDEELEIELEGDDFIEKIAPEIHKGWMKEEDRRIESVGPFFTEKAADLHIKQNHYHYRKPFTYVDSAWRNYEMQGLLQLLFALAGKEVPSQYK